MSPFEYRYDFTRFRAIVEAKQTKKAYLAKLLDVSTETLRAYLDGKTIPRADAIATLAGFYNVPLDYFYERVEKVS